MARYYRRRYTRVVKPKKKWGSNMIGVEMNVVNSGQTITGGYHAVTLATNKTETTSPTPVIVKTGNFKVQGDLHYTGSGTSVGHPSAMLYVVFVPQGMEPTTYAAASSLIANHPEWILAWRFLESNIVNAAGIVDTNRFSFSSRLKRNLNSGDSILAILLVGSLGVGQTCTVNGMCQFWTCAN